MISRYPHGRPVVESYLALPISVVTEPKPDRAEDDIDAVVLTIEHGGAHAEVRVQISHTRCALGGYRRWWLCPTCGQRRGKLLVSGFALGCRTCFAVGYDSQRKWPRTTRREILGDSSTQSRL